MLWGHWGSGLIGFRDGVLHCLGSPIYCNSWGIRFIGYCKISADLGGRVGWLPKAERVKTLFLSPLQPKTRGGGGGGGGGRGGIPASFPSRSPPPKQPSQPTPTPSPGSQQEVCEKIVILVGRAPSPGGPGPKPPGDLAHRPLGPGSRHSHQLTSCKPSWFPKTELYSSMRGGVPPWGPGQQVPEPCIPVKNSKNAPVLIGS